MDYVDTQGNPQGIGVGFIKALNTRLDGRLEIVPLTWSEMVEAVKEKRIDALMDITPRPDREPFFNFTKPYLNIPHSIIARKDGPYYSESIPTERQDRGSGTSLFHRTRARREISRY